MERSKRDTRRGVNLWNSVQLVDDAMDWSNSNKQRIGGQGNFYLTQLFTGHRCCRVYLYKYGHVVDEACLECHNERDTAQHVFFTCSQNVKQRNCLERTIRFQVTSDNEVKLMLTSCNPHELERSMCFSKEGIDATKIG